MKLLICFSILRCQHESLFFVSAFLDCLFVYILYFMAQLMFPLLLIVHKKRKQSSTCGFYALIQLIFIRRRAERCFLTEVEKSVSIVIVLFISKVPNLSCSNGFTAAQFPQELQQEREEDAPEKRLHPWRTSAAVRPETSGRTRSTSPDRLRQMLGFVLILFCN